ncbi:Short-chain dehydrogenase/reductase SDR [Lasiodiplodia theobromae]|uniref:Short-chain dehydrogenase/reductase SDR n=1 Tax=Lasiodiplodia theobromae TaxID=45133 RepID=UPI0015C3E65E|nr:Short-chain dehydrogenase/reductase SDR [Lasiodiplodia theobromae]KAF4536146.1 Short-chain dehydrogenase/reductase SDR [Lasiodiplodia theobromae]
MADIPAYEDVAGCSAALFEWAESYDTKDWDRLRKCVAPTLRASISGPPLVRYVVNVIQVDYRSFLDKIWEDMPADQFIAMASDPKFLGNPLLKTQHFIGASRWQQVSETEITGRHQVRVPHQKYTDESRKTVAVKGHSHGGATMWYKKVDSVWKFAGLCPDIRWFEYDYDQVFADTKVHFNEEDGARDTQHH